MTNLLLRRRGYTPQFLTDIEDGQHQDLKNINKLCRILKHVHDAGARIVIMPDFDADGISAATVGFAGLAELGFQVGLYRPHPENGYGITPSDIKLMQQDFPDAQYIITCDVGITCYDAFDYAYKHGLKVLVTDHHDEEPDNKKPMPLECETIVDPCQLGETYALPDICGAYVFWQVLYRYAETYCSSFAREQIWRLRVFAGIGTIGDSMRIIHENRVLVRNTVDILRLVYNNNNPGFVRSIPGTPAYRAAFRGLFELLSALASEKKLRSADDLDEKFIGWTITPIYNSVKRMADTLGLKSPMDLIFLIFFATDEIIQRDNAQKVININEQRKVTVNSDKNLLMKQAASGEQPYAPFIYLSDAPGGILGLLANQLQEENRIPTFVINKNNLSGSGRSYPYFKVLKSLNNTEFKAEGHQLAFGIQFKDQAQVARFNDYLQANVLPLAKNDLKHHPDTCDFTLAGSPNLADCDLPLSARDAAGFVGDMHTLKPFGVGFTEPEIRVRFRPSESQVQTMGREGQHLKIVLPDGIQLVAWNQAKAKDQIEHEPLASFTGDFSLNKFGGRTSVQMMGDPEIKKGVLV